MALHSEYGVSGGWNGRGTLANLVAELDRQRSTKVDVVADSRTMRVEARSGGARDGALVIVPTAPQTREFIPSEGVEISESALVQIGERVSPSIPAKFLKSLAADRPARAADLVSGLLFDTGKRNLVRMLDGRVRAFLSDRYRTLEHYDLAFAGLEVARDLGAEVLEASLSEKTMRIKMVRRDLWDSIDATRSGDKGGWYAGGLGSPEYLSKVGAKSGGNLPGGAGTIHPVVTLGNSETGHGGLFARLGILHAVCFNLATVETVVANVHLGERLDVGIFAGDTLTAEAKAIMLKARDSIRAAFDEAKFRAVVARIRQANEDVIEAPSTAVGNLVKNSELTDTARDSILAHFLGDYKATRYGLSQAVARYAQEVEDGDEAADVEGLAGVLVTDAGPALLKD